MTEQERVLKTGWACKVDFMPCCPATEVTVSTHERPYGTPPVERIPVEIVRAGTVEAHEKETAGYKRVITEVAGRLDQLERLLLKGAAEEARIRLFHCKNCAKCTDVVECYMRIERAGEPKDEREKRNTNDKTNAPDDCGGDEKDTGKRDGLLVDAGRDADPL